MGKRRHMMVTRVSYLLNTENRLSFCGVILLCYLHYSAKNCYHSVDFPKHKVIILPVVFYGFKPQFLTVIVELKCV
jgi:hypothetical protein